MKKLIMYAGILLFAAACAEKGKTTETPATAEAALPYALETPYKNWQPGDQANAVMVMKMIKAWETRNPEESASYFADTVEITMDMFHAKMSKDSLVPFLESGYVMYDSNLVVTMHDWESVISEDKKDQWVTLWYKQSWINDKGVADSMNVTNDAKIVDGKIVVFQEYIQRYPPGK